MAKTFDFTALLKKDSKISEPIIDTAFGTDHKRVFSKYELPLSRANNLVKLNGSDAFDSNKLYEDIKNLLKHDELGKDLLADFEGMEKSPKGLSRFMEKNKKQLQRVADKFYREFGKGKDLHIKAVTSLLDEHAENMAKLAEDTTKALSVNGLTDGEKTIIRENYDLVSKRLTDLFEEKRGNHEKVLDEIKYLFTEIEEKTGIAPKLTTASNTVKTEIEKTTETVTKDLEGGGGKAVPIIATVAGAGLGIAGVMDEDGPWNWKTAVGAIVGGLGAFNLIKKMGMAAASKGHAM